MEAISCVRPRVIICEIHRGTPIDKALTIPYSDEYAVLHEDYPKNLFRSLSMAAANKLMNKKGYRLIGAHKLGFNVIFLRNDIAQNEFPEISLEEARGMYFDHSAMNQQWEDIKHFPWVEV